MLQHLESTGLFSVRTLVPGLALSSLSFCRSQLEMQELSFCTAGVSGKGLRVEKDGTGVWNIQNRQFNRVSPATAAAIAEEYPSPGLLVQVSPQIPQYPVKILLHGR